MAVRHIRKSRALGAKTLELAVAAPQVVAHRVARAALAGPRPTARDRREFQTMVTEKQAAFAQSCADMTLQMLRANLALSTTMLRFWFSPFTRERPSPALVAAKLREGAIDVLGKGLAPIHRKAVANARRLSRRSLAGSR
jgi:hypothetical protein